MKVYFMKKSLLTLSLLLMTTTLMAMPAKKGLWSTIQLVNGTEVRAQLVGDEHGHWLRDADGNCYIKSESGLYEEVDVSTLDTKRQARKASRRVIYASTSDGLGKYGKMSMGSVPSIGEYTIPVVMVQFSDTKFKSTTTVEKMERYYNEEGYDDESGCVGSVRDYFKAQSGGQFVPTFDIVGIVTLSKASTYYGKNKGEDGDVNLVYLPGDVISAAVSQLGADFSKYVIPAADSNHDKGVPLLVMYYAGKGEATEYDGGESLIWPCEWDAADDIQGGTYSGVHFNSFFVGNELYTGGKSLMGIGLFCHEFGHALGLPDFYCTDYSYEGNDAFGFWSIMDGGSYVGDTRAPIGYTAYEKSVMGWLDLKEIGDAEEITLQSPEGKAENSAFIIRNSSTETFIFENRQPGTWYPSSFGSGVMASRIAYNKSDWYNNILNNTESKKRACMLTADGSKINYYAYSSHLYGNKKTSISTLNTYSGTKKDINLSKIAKNSDGTITLTFNSTPDPGPTPVVGTSLYESFDKCNDQGGNDGLWSGLVARGDFLTDNSGWTSEKPYGANQCAKFGTSKINGSATTPAFTVNGAAKLTFSAGAWNSSNDGTTLELSVSNGTVSPASVTLEKGVFNDYDATITATGDITLTFTTTKGRFFLDEVNIVPQTTGISTLTTNKTSQSYYTLDGRYAGKDLNLLPRGLYIMNGKKVVK